MTKSEAYRVEVHRYVGEPRRIVVWRKGEGGPWIIWGSLPISRDVREDEDEKLISEVWKRLPEPVAQSDADRVYLKLKVGLGQTA